MICNALTSVPACRSEIYCVLPFVHFPRLPEARNVEIGNGKPGQTRFRFSAPASGSFIANFAAGAGSRAGCGAIAVGWLCVSTFITVWVSSAVARMAPAWG